MHDSGGGGRDQASLIASLVIPWREEGDRGEALRHSLRSLDAHLPHGDVTVVGDALPAWATGIANIVLPRLSNRYDDGQANVLAGLKEAQSPWAYIVHDDMIVLHPCDYIAPAHRGALSRYARHGDYYNRAHRMNTWLRHRGIAEPLNYNIHLPFLVDARAFLDIAAECADLPAGFRQSAYGNLMGLRAMRVMDPKVVPTGSKPHPTWPSISMSDRSFTYGYIGKVVRDRFTTPSRYELPSRQN